MKCYNCGIDLTNLPVDRIECPDPDGTAWFCSTSCLVADIKRIEETSFNKKLEGVSYDTETKTYQYTNKGPTGL